MKKERSSKPLDPETVIVDFLNNGFRKKGIDFPPNTVLTYEEIADFCKKHNAKAAGLKTKKNEN